MKILLSLAGCVGLGLLLGRLSGNAWPLIQQSLFFSPHVYITPNETLISALDSNTPEPLTWVSLLPEKEQAAIERYQPAEPQNVQDMTSQILRSIEASNDRNYQQALNSTNTVDWFEGKLVSISGFIVPIDFHEDQSVKSFFLVPYYGACLHFPPPPPNQMIFSQLDVGFVNLDIMQPYTLEGLIELGLFEDPMGTSAYTLNVASIALFNGQPDDVRIH